MSMYGTGCVAPLSFEGACEKYADCLDASAVDEARERCAVDQGERPLTFLILDCDEM